MSSFEEPVTARPYWIGYALALMLTAGAFFLVTIDTLPRNQILLAIAALAIVQTMIHLRYFLHITRKSAPIESIVSLLFALVLLVLMIGGSLWIMTDLNARMGM